MRMMAVRWTRRCYLELLSSISSMHLRICVSALLIFQRGSPVSCLLSLVSCLLSFVSYPLSLIPYLLSVQGISHKIESNRCHVWSVYISYIISHKNNWIQHVQARHTLPLSAWFFILIIHIHLLVFNRLFAPFLRRSSFVSCVLCLVSCPCRVCLLREHTL